MNSVYEALRGTANNPVMLTSAEAKAIGDWLRPLDAQLKTLPREQQDAFITEHRAQAKKRWPQIFPGCHVAIE